MQQELAKSHDRFDYSEDRLDSAFWDCENSSTWFCVESMFQFVHGRSATRQPPRLTELTYQFQSDERHIARNKIRHIGMTEYSSVVCFYRSRDPQRRKCGNSSEPWRIFRPCAQNPKTFPGFFHVDIQGNVLPKLELLRE